MASQARKPDLRDTWIALAIHYQGLAREIEARSKQAQHARRKPHVSTPTYLRERAAHYRQLADLAESETLAAWLRAVADSFLADAAEREAAARLAAELGKPANSRKSGRGRKQR